MKNLELMQLLGLSIDIIGITLLILASLDFIKMINLSSGATLAIIGILLATFGYFITLIGFNKDVYSTLSKIFTKTQKLTV